MKRKKWGCLALTALLFWGLFSGCMQDRREELLEKAGRYLQQGDTALAVRILDTYLEQDPGNIRAKELYAQYYHATEQFLLEAEAYYRLIKQAQDNDIALEGYYLACAGAYLQLGHREDALEIYQEGAARLPQAQRLSQKADELEALLHPPAQLSPKPDKNGVYHMTHPGEKRALQVMVSEAGAAPGADYRQTAESFEAETGHTVSCQALPQGVSAAGFQMKGDLCFIGTRQELDALAAAGVLVSLEEMRGEFAALGEGYREELCARGPDGEIYALPVCGGWSGLFINREALESCGVSPPGEGYIWQQFLKDCEAVKDGGLIPIAAEDTEDGRKLWIELGLWNHISAGDEPAAMPWAQALEDLKELYDKGYIQRAGQTKDAPETASPCVSLLEGEAAFMLGDENDCVNLATAAQRSEEARHIYVTPPPVKDAAKAGQVASSLTGGWAMSRAAWDDPEKRLAAVSLYSRLTALNEAGGEGAYLLTALKKNGGGEEKDAFQKMLERSFFSIIRGVRPSTLDELTAAGGRWPTALLQVLAGALTPQEAAAELEGTGEQEEAENNTGDTGA